MGFLEQHAQNQQFLNSLSHFLRLEVMECVNSSTILLNPFFQEMPRPVLQRVCALCESLLCGHQDIVVHRGHRATSMMFLLNGIWNVVYQGNTKKNEVIRPPHWIGYTCLFMDMLWPNTYISVGHSELLKLGKGELLELLADFPESDRIYKTYQRRIKEGVLIGTGAQCGICKKMGHSSNCCSEKDNHEQGSGTLSLRGKKLRNTMNLSGRWQM